LAPGLWQRHSELAGRVENILHRRRNTHPWLSRGLVAAGLAASLSGVVVLQRCPGIVSFATNDSVAAAPVVEPVYQDLHQAQYHEAVFHPLTNQPIERTSTVPAPRTKRQVRTPRRLQFVQLTTDEDGGGMTLILFTVEVPQSTKDSHGQSLITPDNWIAFQI
jgi:hypothetical protein